MSHTCVSHSNYYDEQYISAFVYLTVIIMMSNILWTGLSLNNNWGKQYVWNHRMKIYQKGPFWSERDKINRD